jgi:hypothetical protein
MSTEETPNRLEVCRGWARRHLRRFFHSLISPVCQCKAHSHNRKRQMARRRGKTLRRRHR